MTESGSKLRRWLIPGGVLVLLAVMALTLFFIFILTPAGWVLRLAGKDPLQLKRPAKTDTFWQTAKDASPLDRLF